MSGRPPPSENDPRLASNINDDETDSGSDDSGDDTPTDRPAPSEDDPRRASNIDDGDDDDSGGGSPGGSPGPSRTPEDTSDDNGGSGSGGTPSRPAPPEDDPRRASNIDDGDSGGDNDGTPTDRPAPPQDDPRRADNTGDSPTTTVEETVDVQDVTEQDVAEQQGVEFTGSDQGEFIVDGEVVTQEGARQQLTEQFTEQSELIEAGDVEAQISQRGEVTFVATQAGAAGLTADPGEAIGRGEVPKVTTEAQAVERQTLEELGDDAQREDVAVQFDDGEFTVTPTEGLAAEQVAEQIEQQEGVEATAQDGQVTVQSEQDLSGVFGEIEEQFESAVDRERTFNELSTARRAGASMSQPADLERGEDFTVDVEETEQGLEFDADLTEDFKSELSTDIARQRRKLQETNEQFGDIPVQLPGGTRLETRLQELSQGVQETGQDVGDALFAEDTGFASESGIAEVLEATGNEQAADAFESKLRSGGKGIVGGATALADIPGLAAGVKEGAELTAFSAGEISAGRGGQLAGDLGSEAEESVDAAVDFVRENPAQFSGMAVGSLAASVGAFSAARQVGPRTSLATRAAIQPGEEALGIGGFKATQAVGRAVPNVKGDVAAQKLFPNKEPLIFSEEAALRKAGAAKQKLFGDTDAGPTSTTRRQRISAKVGELKQKELGIAQLARDERGMAQMGRIETETQQEETQQVQIEDRESVAELDAETRLEQEQAQRSLRQEQNKILRGEEARIEPEGTEEGFTARERGGEFVAERKGGGFTGDVEVDAGPRSGPRGPQVAAFRAEIETKSELEQLLEQTSPRLDVETETQPQVRRRGRLDIETRTETETETMQEQAQKAEARVDTEIESRTQPAVDTDTETDILTDLFSETRTETRADTLLETETETETLNELETETETEVETEQELEQELEQEVELEAEQELELEQELEQELELETEIESELEQEVEAQRRPQDKKRRQDEPFDPNAKASDVFDNPTLSPEQALKFDPFEE